MPRGPINTPYVFTKLKRSSLESNRTCVVLYRLIIIIFGSLARCGVFSVTSRYEFCMLCGAMSVSPDCRLVYKFVNAKNVFIYSGRLNTRFRLSYINLFTYQRKPGKRILS
jgi:hypothetical protein